MEASAIGADRPYRNTVAWLAYPASMAAGLGVFLALETLGLSLPLSGYLAVAFAMSQKAIILDLSILTFCFLMMNLLNQKTL